jgi:Spy/CpxP family protein refolding chaperone
VEEAMMERRVTLAGVLAVGFLATGLVFGDDAKPAKADAPKAKITMPTYFNQLGLLEEQKAKLMAVRADFQPKIDAATKELKELQEKQREECGKILTPEQRTHLEKIMAARSIRGADGKMMKITPTRSTGDSENDKNGIKKEDKKEDKKK